MKKAILAAITVSLLTGCGIVMDDYTWIKERSNQYYTERGFTVKGYQGYNMWAIGRCYWYTTEKDETMYESCLLKWNGEVHEYDLKAINAIKGTAGAG